jgi:ferrochelatase
MAETGAQKALGFILSSHQTEASWERYQKNIEDARVELAGNAPEVDYCPGWHDHPLFIRSWAERIEACLGEPDVKSRSDTPLVFTAHSLPAPMAARSPYVAQVEATARMIAAELGHHRWSLAYQSRSGKPSDPWLEPDVSAVIRGLAAERATNAVIAPIGFVCDHVEVLYDLDIETKNLAADLGLRVIRTPCPNDHRTFIRMMAEIISSSAAARRGFR